MIEIIPAMDLIGGRCVRLLQGDFDKETVYSEDPVGIAKGFEDAGIRRLHMVDLDGARTGSMKHLDVLREVTSATDLMIDYGGGVRTPEDVESIFSFGASMVTVGSLAVRSPDVIGEWAREFGADNVLIGVDGRNGNTAVDGWQTDAAVSIDEALSRLTDLGLKNFFVTDISKDGAMEGAAVDLYRALLGRHPDINLSASGGVRTMQDIAALENIGCTGVIVGRALYEGTITLEEVMAYAR